MEAASTLLGPLPSNATTYNMNIPITPSLTNLAPFSVIGGLSFWEEDYDETTETETDEFHITDLRLEQSYERCTDLWKIARDEAGPWMTHRFTLSEWDCKTKPHPKYRKKQDAKKPEAFDGVLTKHIIIPNLSRLARSPEFEHYAYTKCVLEKMKLTDISAIKSYRYLQYIDVSWNKLTTLKPLGNLPFLKILDASHNLLTSVLDFKAPFFLTIANLSHNKIKNIKDISAFWSITDLNLSHNMIKVIHGIKDLRFLTTLNLSSNRIERIENLTDLRVQFLFLQNNVIRLTEKDDKANLHTLKNIRTINLSCNEISSLKMLGAVENLEALDIADNNISRLLDIYYLRQLKYLNNVNLLGNPVIYLRRYVEICVSYIQNLVTLDGEPLDSDYWLEKISNQSMDVTQEAAHNRLQLIVLEQLSPPRIASWMLPYDCPPLAVIVLVGLCASRKSYIAHKLCEENHNVVVGVPHSTKHKGSGDIEEDDYHYVDEETFMKMLKNSEFLTYQEHLGSYYGIAHDEFKKAQNGILIFHANLTVALSIRRRFLSTVFVLGLPSTEQAHIEILCSLYAVKFLDDGCVKILDSPSLAQRCKQEFENEKLRAHDAHEVLDELVQEVCRLLSRPATEVVPEEEQTSQSTKQSLSSPVTSFKKDTISLESEVSDFSQVSEILQLWWSTNPVHSLSLVIHPANVSSFCMGGRESAISRQSKVNLENIQHTPQIKRYVSFTVAHVHKIPSSADASLMDGVDTTAKDYANQASTNQESNKENDKISSANNDDSDSSNSLKDEHPKTNSKFGEAFSPFSAFKKNICDYKTYVDMLLHDARLKSVFEEELREREELLELHLDMPGLFREVVFTDHEDETIRSLNAVVKDVTRYCDTTKAAILDFTNDLSCTGLIKAKIDQCFKELKKEGSTSDKQAAEFTLRDPVQCQHGACNQPNCLKWTQL